MCVHAHKPLNQRPCISADLIARIEKSVWYKKVNRLWEKKRKKTKPTPVCGPLGSLKRFSPAVLNDLRRLTEEARQLHLAHPGLPGPQTYPTCWLRSTLPSCSWHPPCNAHCEGVLPLRRLHGTAAPRSAADAAALTRYCSFGFDSSVSWLNHRLWLKGKPEIKPVTSWALTHLLTYFPASCSYLGICPLIASLCSPVFLCVFACCCQFRNHERGRSGINVFFYFFPFSITFIQSLTQTCAAFVLICEKITMRFWICETAQWQSPQRIESVCVRCFNM